MNKENLTPEFFKKISFPENGDLSKITFGGVIPTGTIIYFNQEENDSET